MLRTLVTTDVDTVKEAVEAISGLVQARAAEIDRARRLPDDLVSALRRTGINRMFMPTVLGGLQAPVLDMMDFRDPSIRDSEAPATVRRRCQATALATSPEKRGHLPRTRWDSFQEMS